MPCLPSDRLLNLLIYVKSYLDGTLTFRRSCAHGVCGSDAMRINGVNRLACKVLMRDLLPKKAGKQLTVTIEPIRGLPVEKDLVVNMEPFFDAYRAVKPYLITSGNAPTRERYSEPYRPGPLRRHHQVHPVRLLHHELPGVLERGQLLRACRDRQRAPVHLRQPRRGGGRRLEILNDVDGVWRCRTTFNCTDACPRGIEVTKAIQEVKRALMFTR